MIFDRSENASTLSMAALEAAIQGFWVKRRMRGPWMAGSSPAMENGGAGAVDSSVARRRSACADA